MNRKFYYYWLLKKLPCHYRLSQTRALLITITTQTDLKGGGGEIAVSRFMYFQINSIRLEITQAKLSFQKIHLITAYIHLESLNVRRETIKSYSHLLHLNRHLRRAWQLCIGLGPLSVGQRDSLLDFQCFNRGKSNFTTQVFCQCTPPNRSLNAWTYRYWIHLPDARRQLQTVTLHLSSIVFRMS